MDICHNLFSRRLSCATLCFAVRTKTTLTGLCPSPGLQYSSMTVPHSTHTEIFPCSSPRETISPSPPAAGRPSVRLIQRHEGSVLHGEALLGSAGCAVRDVCPHPAHHLIPPHCSLSVVEARQTEGIHVPWHQQLSCVWVRPGVRLI